MDDQGNDRGEGATAFRKRPKRSGKIETSNHLPCSSSKRKVNKILSKYVFLNDKFSGIGSYDRIGRHQERTEKLQRTNMDFNFYNAELEFEIKLIYSFYRNIKHLFHHLTKSSVTSNNLLAAFAHLCPTTLRGNFPVVAAACLG